MSRPEILAPAGNREMLGAAVFSGADAVYLGLTGFNARRTAGNFTPEELQEAVSFCHARGVKVHVTLNTLVYDRELAGLADAVRAVAAAGADAVIADDLAAAQLVKSIAPTLHLHGSTQMSVHTPELRWAMTGSSLRASCRSMRSAPSARPAPSRSRSLFMGRSAWPCPASA